MKAQLRQVKIWTPPEDKGKPEFEDGRMRVYIGSLHVGWVEPSSTEPEELFRFCPIKLLFYLDEAALIDRTKEFVLQEILDNIELLFKEFINKICV